MAAGSDSAKARASREATDWLILLRDDPDDLDLHRRFDAWLAGDPLNAAAWAATWHLSGLLARIPPMRADRTDGFAARPARRPAVTVYGLADRPEGLRRTRSRRTA